MNEEQTQQPQANVAEQEEKDLFEVNLDQADADPDDELPAQSAEDNNKEKEDYALSIEEKHKVDTDVNLLMTRAAQAAQLPQSAVSQFINETLAGLNEQARQKRIEQTQKLREDWGGEFEQRIAKTERFIARSANAAGLTAADIAVLRSPQGFRLMYAISKMFSERRAVQGTPVDNSPAARLARARALITDPLNPYYKGMNDLNATESERLAAHKAYNEIRGMNIFPV